MPHAGLGYHFLRVQVGNHWILEVFKRKEGPKRKIEGGERVEQVDGGPLTSANALALYQNLKIQAGTQS